MNIMKRLLYVLLLSNTFQSNAQDVIVKKDGSTILSKVLEVNPSDIKYKKYSNQDGPTYTINVADIMSINYENGDKDDFSKRKEKQVSEEVSPYPLINKTADARNIEILALYNKQYFPTQELKNSSKKTKALILIFGLKPSSIMSNEDIELSFVRKVTNIGMYYEHVIYNLNILNKTNQTIYIDKGNSFKIWNNGLSNCYYDPSEQTSVSSGGGSGVSLGLGAVAGILGIGGTIGQLASGVNVGGGTSHTVTTTYSQQRVIAIPPHANRNLIDEKFVYTKKGVLYNDLKAIEEAEIFDFEELKRDKEFRAENDYITFGGPYEKEFVLPNNLVRTGEVLNYEENN